MQEGLQIIDITQWGCLVPGVYTFLILANNMIQIQSRGVNFRHVQTTSRILSRSWWWLYLVICLWFVYNLLMLTLSVCQHVSVDLSRPESFVRAICIWHQLRMVWRPPAQDASLFFKEDMRCCIEQPFHASRVVPLRIKSPPEGSMEMWQGLAPSRTATIILYSSSWCWFQMNQQKYGLEGEYSMKM